MLENAGNIQSDGRCSTTDWCIFSVLELRNEALGGTEGFWITVSQSWSLMVECVLPIRAGIILWTSQCNFSIGRKC